MLATENTTGLYVSKSIYITNTNKLGYNIIDSDWRVKKQELYITSNDEIKKSWYLDYHLNRVVKCGSFSDKISKVYNDKCKKIIATTDPELHKDGVAKIGLPFIEKYITEYNKGVIIKEVNVEIGEHYKLPITRADGTIIIHKVQEVFTKEDMKKAFYDESYTKGDVDSFETWFEQNY